MINRKIISLSALTLLTLPLLTPVAHADAKGETILRAAFKKLGESKAMTAKLMQSFQTLDGKTLAEYGGTISALKPNYLTVEIKADGPNGSKRTTVYAADGKDYYAPSPTEPDVYTVAPNKPNPTDFPGEWEAEIDSFFGGEKLLEKGTPEFGKVEKIGKISCDVVLMKMKPVGEVPARTLVYYVGQKDKLIYRSSWQVVRREGTFIQANTLSEINLKAEKKPSDFAYTPSKDLKKFVPKKKREVIFAHFQH